MIGLRCFKEMDQSRNFSGSSIACLAQISTSEDGGDILKHEVIREGKFVHPLFGIISITLDDLSNVIKNFGNRITGTDLVFNIDHYHEKGALGWHKDLTIVSKDIEIPKSDGNNVKQKMGVLVSTTELTPFGKTEIIDLKKYKYTSAELRFDFVRKDVLDDAPEDSKDEPKPQPDPGFGMTLMGSAATNIPFIPDLAEFSEVDAEGEDLYYKLLEETGDLALCFQALNDESIRRALL